ncbi:MAG: hypothetical protein ACRC2R_05590 [Xenococcaceae cyanobacterium]
MINSYVSTRSSKDQAQPEWISADEIGDYVAWLTSDESLYGAIERALPATTIPIINNTSHW